ncbi:hypothetical protein SOVF_066830, partial [Spinacia oleracea]
PFSLKQPPTTQIIRLPNNISKWNPIKLITLSPLVVTLNHHHHHQQQQQQQQQHTINIIASITTTTNIVSQDVTIVPRVLVIGASSHGLSLCIAVHNLR